MRGINRLELVVLTPELIEATEQNSGIALFESLNLLFFALRQNLLFIFFTAATWLISGKYPVGIGRKLKFFYNG